MNDTYLQLLELLEPWGIDREVQIEAQLYEWFTHQINVDPYEPYDSVNARIVRFLDVISDNKHIFFAKSYKESDGKEQRYQVQARLTFQGLQFLYEHRLRKSTLELNESLKVNTVLQNQLDTTIANNSSIQATQSGSQTTIFRRQTIILGVVGFFALISMAVSIMTYILDNNTKQLSAEIEQLKQDNLKLKKELLLLLKNQTKNN